MQLHAIELAFVSDPRVSQIELGTAVVPKSRMVIGDINGKGGSTRQAIKSVALEQASKLYIYPEQYEGEESDPLIFCTGPVTAQQVDPLIPWLMRQTGAKKFFLPSADYIWPHTMNRKVRRPSRLHVLRRELPALGASRAQASSGRFRIVKQLGVIEPNERAVGERQANVAAAA